MKFRIPFQLATFGVAICGSFSSHAADIIKANNLANLIDGTSWAGVTSPGASDSAVFDAAYTTATAESPSPRNADCVSLIRSS